MLSLDFHRVYGYKWLMHNTVSTLIRKPATGLLVALFLLGIVYLLTLQTIPNGSSHYYMIDVGETQIVLNQWGTLHATGYPLYVITGNLLTTLMRLIGIDSVTAPALVSLLWSLASLALIYRLANHLTGRIWLSATMTVLFGLTRTMWIHGVIAEIYSFTLLILVLLLTLALWREAISHRIYWLALIGGIGVAHHRAIAMSIPALLYAVWPEFQHTPHTKLPRLILLSLTLGLMGLVQYAYLYLRAQAGADWVYGQPGTLAGLWDEIIGTEASRFIGPPESLTALIDNFNQVNLVLVRDLTLPGITLGILGLIIAIQIHQLRRAAITFALTALAAYAFHVFWYRDILSALILPIILSLAFGWLFLADALLKYFFHTRIALVAITLTDVIELFNLGYAFIRFVLIAITLAGVVALFNLNFAFIDTLTTDPTGLQTIEQMEQAPPESTVMLAWGPRYFAASAGKLLMNDLAHIDLVDDKHNLAEITETATLITPEYTFFNQPVDWWRDKLGQPVYLQAAAPGFVSIRTSPVMANPPLSEGITVASETLSCEPERLILDVIWQTGDKPTRDLSIFVKAFDSDGNLVGQGDQSAPVYGWRPLTTWVAGEQVRDIYPIEVTSDSVTEVRYGMYRTLGDGSFENVSEYVIPVNCRAEDS